MKIIKKNSEKKGENHEHQENVENCKEKWQIWYENGIKNAKIMKNHRYHQKL